MLLFNDLIKYIKSEVKRFQNISCYCLTVGNYELSLRNPSFQNISCYCLTTTGSQATDLEDEFQNISCYCLTFYSD